MTIDEILASALIFPGLGKGHRRGTDSTIVNRLPILRFLPRGFRAHFVAMCGEFTGTFLFLFFAFSGTQVANNQIQAPADVNQGSNPAQLLYISLVFGFSLAANAWVFFRVSGGLFNPAVTFGLCLVGALDCVRGALIAITQIMGAITAAAVVSALFLGTLSVRTTLSAGTSVSRGLFIEMFLTAQLVFTIFMLAAEKHKATFIAPVGIGLSLFIAELSGVYYTGGSLNPARSLAPDVVLHKFDHYHWIYWLGPILGAVLASGFYWLMKKLEYETANPGQDFNQEEKEHFDPNVHKSAPGVSFGPSEVLPHEKHEGSDNMTERTADTEYYDPVGAKASPGSHTAGMGSHSAGQKIVKGSRKNDGRSPAQEISGTTIGESSSAYAAGPSIESGHHT